MAEVGADTARRHVDKIAASEGFLNSERLCRFLRFTVEAKLRGEGDQIKEYLLGREVFDRSADYDPRIDPIVRVEARRLRKKLEEYYEGPGREDALRVDYPKGSYAPEFQSAVPAANGSTRAADAGLSIRHWAWLLAGAALVAGVAGGLYFRQAKTEPAAVAVVPARWIWKSEHFSAALQDVDLAERIGAEMVNRHGIQVASWPSLQRFREGKWTTAQIASATGVGRVLIVSVRGEPEGARVTAFLVDGKSERKVSVADKQTQALDTPESRQSVAREIAATIAEAR
jgi:TolB-like protein